MKRLLSTLGMLFSLIVGLCLSSPNLAAATLTIDKEDFPPGAFAIIDGAGFGAGEEVVLTVIHVNDPNDPAESWTERADENGAFVTFWYVNENALNDTLLLTAVGQSSGLTAEKTFTDAVAVGTFSASFNTASGTNPGSYNVVLTVNNINTGVAATTDDMHAVQVIVPAGASVTWGTVSAFNAANSPLTWDQTPNVIAAGVYGFTRNNSATTKVPPGGKVTIAMTINVSAASSCFGIGAFGNNGYGQAFSGNGSTLVCFGLTNPGVAPSFTACPLNPTANAVGACSAAVNYTATASGTATINYTYSFSGATTGSGSGTGSGESFNVGTTTVTVTATNGTGSATCVFNVVVSDLEAPSIASIPSGGSAAADASCQASIPDVATGTSASDNCTPAGSLTKTQSPAAGTSVGVGTHTIVVTVTDAANNSSSSSTTFTVSDTTNPTIACPANITVDTDPGACGAVVSFTVTGSDNCPGVTVVSTPPSGSTFPVGTTTVTSTATDAAGNSATCSFTVTVEDNEDPAISCPANITVDTDPGACGAVVSFTVTGSDNCPGVTVASTPPSGSTFPVGTTTVTSTATDAAGNSSACSFTVTVEDNEDPTINCPANITVDADPGVCGAVVNFAVTGSDNCPGVTVVSVPASGSVFAKGTTTVTSTATDAAGNSATCSFTVTVEDNEDPTINCPANITVGTDPGACSAVVNFTVTGADNCPGVSVVSVPASGSVFPKGTTTVTSTATDAEGNSVTCTFDVIVEDNEDPTINCPANMTADTDPGACGAVVNFAVTGSDNCPGVTVVSTPASGSTFPVGTTTVISTATDAAGNSATCSFTVTVEDNEDPTISCPANITVDTDSGACSAVVNFTVTGSDNCPGVTVVSVPASGSSFPKGTTTVISTATDANGNSVTCSFTVTVEDNEDPAITSVPANVSVNNDAGVCGAVVSYAAAAAADNCPGVAISYSQDSGTLFPVGTTTVTVTATDTSGNSVTSSFTVTVTDNEAPIVTAPANVTVNAEPGLCTATVAVSGATANDNCDGALAPTSDSPGVFAVGTHTVTWSVTDSNGNTGTATQTVSVVDDQDPTITAPGAIVANTNPGACYATVNLGTPITGDNCAVALVENNAPAQFPKGVTTVTWTVTDVNGNTATDTQTVTVIDNENPTISCPANIVVSAPANLCGAVVNFNVGFGDNCPGASITYLSHASGSTFAVGTTTVNATVTDAAGNEAACSFTVTVNDVTGPTVVTKTATVNLVNGAGSITVADVNNGSSDACGIASYQLSKSAFNCLDIGAQTVILSATDVNGNTSSAPATVNVIGQALQLEDTDSVYTGAQTFWTTSDTSSTASLALSATIRTTCGDITLAKIRFQISDKAEGPWTSVTGDLNVGRVTNVVDPSGGSVGSASATVQYNIGNNNAITLYVRVLVVGYYELIPGCNTISPISVSKPGTGRTTGSLKISNTTTPVATGILATSGTSTLPGRAEVSMGVWYNRSGANPQGGVSGIICAGGRIYSYKSTAISTFSVKVGSATFSSKCVLKDITNPNSPISLDSGNMMQFTVTDGSPDKASLVINRSSSLGGGVWYSSAWQNNKTVEKTIIAGGNMTIAP